MFSIYVPRVLNEHTVQSVTNVMAHFNIGIVQYVDFTPINKKPGFYETFDAKYKSAFIHFVEVPGYQINTQFWTLIQEQEQGYKLHISPNEYWICLKNHTPIQRTMMNIHQVVENGRYLEDRIKTLEDNNKLLQDNYKTLEDTNKLLQDKLALLQDRFDTFISPMTQPPKLQRQDTICEPTCDTWNTDTTQPMTTQHMTQDQTMIHRHWNVLDKSLFTKSKDMSDKDFLRYCEYEYNWSYDNRFDR